MGLFFSGAALREFTDDSVKMDQRPYPGPSLLFHARMTALFIILWVTDLLLFMIAVDSTLAYGISGMVLFASEVSRHWPCVQINSSD
jgi:hypothetical protein